MSHTVFIVTGAAGHLGIHVVRELLLQGQEVRALVLSGESCPEFAAVDARLLKEYVGDVCVPASMEPLFEGDGSAEFIVIHCAGIVTISSRTEKRVHDVNVGGTANVISACRRHCVKRLVYISSVHAIPLLPHGQTMREIPFFCPDAVVGQYAKTKAVATQLVLDAGKDGLDTVVIHPSGVIGPNGLPTGNMTQLFTLYLNGRLPAAVHGGFDFVDVRDVALGIVAASDQGKRGECYILSNRFIDLKELFAILSEVSGQKKIGVYLPLWVAKLGAPFAEAYYHLARKTPVFTSYSLHTLSENGVYSHDKASGEFGYSARTLKETLRDTTLWMKSGRFA